jgi:dolichol kinase
LRAKANGIVTLEFLFIFPLIVGIIYGQEKVLPNKSLQGSLAGFLVCYFLSVAYALHHLVSPNLFNVLVFSILAGLIGMTSELASASRRVDDNLSIPLLSALGLSFINSLIPLY